LGKLGLETPLIYSGGIRSVEDAVKVIQIGADRIMVDTLLYDNLDIVRDIAKELGAQAVIASLPLCWKNFEIKWLNYRSRDKALISNRVLELLKSGSVSEVLITDCEHEGVHNSFEVKLIEEFPLKDVSIIVFGGISNSAQMRTLLNFNAIVAIAIGNFLTYHEHAVQKYKEALIGSPLRQASYKSIFN
jgi:cyclase